jgi:hypothetical protein
MATSKIPNGAAIFISAISIGQFTILFEPVPLYCFTILQEKSSEVRAYLQGIAVLMA